MVRGDPVSDRLVVFARQPIPGTVKTRLAAAIGADASAEVYAYLLAHAVATAMMVDGGVILSLAEPADREWVSRFGAQNEVQGGGDLGRRMAECFRRRFSEGAVKVVIIGSDNACVAPEHLTAAFDALDEVAVVIGPAQDGGYWLVGQRSPGVDLFSDIPWSSPETLAATRLRLGTLGVAWRELENLPDIDTVDDLYAALHDPRVPSALKKALRRSTPPDRH
jgi:rSAM/selenodomain-associated transferase 1